MDKVIIKAIDGYKLELNLYESNKPKGYIQLIHGMEEHQDRYIDFASFLCKKGYTVITANLRGHGKNASIPGYFANERGYELLIKDEETILKYILDKYNVEKINLFAHSMGTIIARNLLHENSKYYDKVILSGYPTSKPGTSFGIFLSDVVILFNGPKANAKLLHYLAVDSFNNSVKNSKTNLDWVSCNEENIEKYINDPLCGIPFKVSALKDLFILVNRMNKKSLFKDVNKDLKLLLLRGEEDPCTGFDKGAEKSLKALSNAGFNYIENITYKNMRHEVLNETNKEIVYEDILKFLQSE